MKRTWAMTLVASIAACMAAWAGISGAESEEAGTELQSYFSNANTSGGQAFVNITAPLEGNATASNLGMQQGEICANIYGFDTNQSLQVCCGCPITADGLLALSISGNIAPNPIGSTSILMNGSIRILASDPLGNAGAELVAWASHIENTNITESEFQVDVPDPTELDELPEACADIIQLGSGAGICNCGFPTEPSHPEVGCDPNTGLCCDPTTFVPPPKVIFLTSGTSFTVPSDWNDSNNSIQCIGAGGGGHNGFGGGGGGGGAYCKTTNLTLTPGNSAQIQIGTGGFSGTNGTASWFNGTSATTASCGAAGGSAGSASTGGAGGTTAGSSGTTLFQGGNGGNAVADDVGGGGGGAGGPNGAGVNGANATATTSGTGGAGDAGAGGTGGAQASAGGNGTEFQTSPAFGSGGGGGGGPVTGGQGGNYGGGGGGGNPLGDGGGGGANGLCVVTYTPM